MLRIEFGVFFSERIKDTKLYSEKSSVFTKKKDRFAERKKKIDDIVNKRDSLYCLFRLIPLKRYSLKAIEAISRFRAP